MTVIGVYMIEHLPTGRRYVGWSHDVNRRVAQHFFESATRREMSSILHRAMAKYGRSEFAWRLLQSYADDAAARDGEVAWIARLRTVMPHGFNLTSGGEGVRGLRWNAEQRARKASWATGRKDSPQTLEKKRASRLAYLAGPGGDTWRASMATLRGSKRTPETRTRMAAAAKGRRHTEESKAKISEAKKNPSEETRLKISLAGIGRRHTEETRAKIAATLKARFANGG